MIVFSKYKNLITSIFIVCFFSYSNAHSEQIYLVCKLTTESNIKYNKEIKPRKTKDEYTLVLDSNTGAILEGSIAQGLNKVDNFITEVHETSFNGYLSGSERVNHIYKPGERVYLIAYYSLDRFTGKFNAYVWYRILDNEGHISIDFKNSEIEITEKGECSPSPSKRF